MHETMNINFFRFIITHDCGEQHRNFGKKNNLWYPGLPSLRAGQRGESCLDFSKVCRPALRPTQASCSIDIGKDDSFPANKVARA